MFNFRSHENVISIRINISRILLAIKANLNLENKNEISFKTANMEKLFTQHNFMLLS